MTLGKLLLFLKNLDLLDQTVTRESVSIIFAQRCPDKFADFAGFVDILYKVHKLFDHPFHYEIVNKKDNQKPHKHQKFQAFIQERIFDKQEQLNNADDSKGSSLARLNTTESDLYSIDNLALQILEDHHEELKKVKSLLKIVL